MKMKIIVAIAAFMVFGLSIAAVAYTRTTASASVAASCCAKGDSCPMKGKNSSTGEKASCCDDCDCCSGDSCPMKKKDKASATDTKNADSESCPMMKNAKAETVSFDKTNVIVVADGESCCCSCCSKSKERKDTVGT
jgi:hypothetical protein